MITLSWFHGFGVEKFSPHLDGEPAGFQAHTARAFLNGDLDMGPAPEGLLALSDPLDPAANFIYRSEYALHDFSLYQGRIYSPFGPSPALLLHVPYRLLVGQALDPGLSTAVFSVAWLVVALFAYREITARMLHSRPWWADAGALAAFGLASPMPWLITIGRSYEETIACGAFLTMAGIALFSTATKDTRSAHLGALVGTGVTLGLAFGARPHLLGTGLLIAAAVIWLLRWRPEGWRIGLAAILVPYLSLIGAVLLYNHARFGSPIEFGTHYQMAGVHPQSYDLFNLRNLPGNLADYLISGPRLEPRWPHVHLLENTYAHNPTQHSNEPVTGMLTTFPFIFVGLRCLPLAFRRSGYAGRQTATHLILLFLLAVGLLTSVSLPFSSSTMRYTVDFIPVFALLATVSAVVALGAPAAEGEHRGLRRIWASTLVWSALAGVLLSLTSCPGTGSC